ncbi:MAG: alpha/beta fold hydrolase [Myxococcota bacterium]
MTVDSIELPHRWQGAGEPLVLIAGLGGKGTSWQPFLERATRSYRVLTFDNPGAGGTPPLSGPVSIRAMARSVNALLERLGVSHAHVVGRSMGGMIAQELALLAPDRVRRLILVSTCARVDAHLTRVFRLWARMARSGVPLELRHESSMLWCLGHESLASSARVRAYLQTRGSADRPRDYARQAEACAQHDALDRLHALQVPTLVVAGTDDRLMPAWHAETLAKAIPGAQLGRVPGAGHLPYLEQPELFARCVLRFLGGEGAGDE